VTYEKLLVEDFTVDKGAAEDMRRTGEFLKGGGWNGIEINGWNFVC
jgi:hypothetical protein